MKGGQNLQLDDVLRKIVNNKLYEKNDILSLFSDADRRAVLSDILDDGMTTKDILDKIKNKEYKSTKIHGGITTIGKIRNAIKENKESAESQQSAQTQQTTEQPGSSSDQSSSSSNTTVAELLKQMEDFRDNKMEPLVNATTETVSKIQTYIADLMNKFKAGNVDTQKTIKDLTDKNKELTDEKTTLQNKINEMEQQTTTTTSKIAEKENEITQLKQEFKNEKKKLEDTIKEKEEVNQLMLEDKVTQQQRHADKIEKIQNDITNLTTEKQNLTQQLQKQNDELKKLNEDLTNVKAIKEVIKQITEKTKTLVENNNKINETIKDQQGGYQYKSKNKTRSKRMLKLNRFGLLKSKSKTRKGKKNLKVKKNKKSVKGGMKTRSKPKRKSKKGKKTRKGKKNNNKRK